MKGALTNFWEVDALGLRRVAFTRWAGCMLLAQVGRWSALRTLTGRGAAGQMDGAA